jgi:hypothetical protein
MASVQKRIWDRLRIFLWVSWHDPRFFGWWLIRKATIVWHDDAPSKPDEDEYSGGAAVVVPHAPRPLSPVSEESAINRWP